MNGPASNRVVIYENNARWVAVINLAFAAVGVYLSLRFVEGGLGYLMVVFLSLFSLFWFRDAVFGLRLKLVSDGTRLEWQEGNRTGFATIKQIQKVAVREEIKGPADSSFTWMNITLHMSDGKERSIPPNLAAGLRCKNWRILRKLVAHIRTISPVAVVSSSDPPECIPGLTDQQRIEA